MGSLARLKRTALAIATATALGCASASTSGTTGSEPTTRAVAAMPRATPLAMMAGRPVLVLPVQYVAFGDSLNWRQQFPPGLLLLGTVDDSIASSLADRGLSGRWTFAPAITASARRNAGMTADPHALAAEGLRRLVAASDDPLSEPLASQIRSLVAFGDARYVLLPSMLRFENAGSAGRARLLLYLIDARTARITWSGEVVGDVSRGSYGEIAGKIAEGFADLVVAR